MNAIRSTLVLLLCAAIGCSKDATGPEPSIAKIEAASPLYTQATVGTAVTDRPTVIVRDSRGDPIAGAPVYFSRVPAYIAVPAVLTDASGRATVAEWIVSSRAGPNLLRASSGRFQIEFVANGVAGAAAKIRKISGDGQLARPLTTLAMAPAVEVRDAFDNLVAGVTVTFAVTAGGGSLTVSTAISNSDGIASLQGWTLGSQGEQVLSASIDDAPPVSFTATVSNDPCVRFSLAEGQSSTVDLRAFSCVMDDGRAASFFSFKTTARQAYDFELVAEKFSAVLDLSTNDGIPVGEALTAGLSPKTLRAILPAGEYLLRVTPKVAGASGGYGLSAKRVAESTSDCQETAVTLGVKTYQVLEKGDCEPALNYFEDRYAIYLETGTKVTVTMASDDVDNVINVTDDVGSHVAGTHATGMYDGIYGARVIFTVQRAGFHHIVATTDYFSGQYSLTVEGAKQ